MKNKKFVLAVSSACLILVGATGWSLESTYAGSKFGAPTVGMSVKDYQSLVKLDPQNTIGVDWDVVRGMSGYFLIDNQGEPTVSVVDYNLHKLQQGGYLRRLPEVSRGIELLDGVSRGARRDFVKVPVMGNIAAGEPLGLKQEDISYRGFAAQFRINAEDPRTFVPSPGLVTNYHAPGGLGVRVDSALYAGYRVPPFYDGLIAKLIAHGSNRNECLMRLRRALEELVVDGIQASTPLHRDIVAAQDFVDGEYDIHWLERFVDSN